ncbi:MAG: hypoxanthine phosphoribosyltransferase [Gammaproteobacteria bacterium]|nr:hypoxanthine phosphoribosyltransferase [Gammaproteobacteria bacterium]
MLDGFRLGASIYESGFRPNFIVGIWRGGSSVGIVVQECLAHLGVPTDHISIRTSYQGMSTYHEIVENKDAIRVHGLKYLFHAMNAEDRLLIVDDVFSSGHSIEAVISMLKTRMRKNIPKDIRIAVPWYKPSKNKTGRVPNFYLHETDKWLVLPYELEGLTLEDIRQHKTGVAHIFDDWQDTVSS